MSRRLFLLCLVMCLLGGCSAESAPQQTSYTATFLDLFDTVTTVVGYAPSKQEFEAQAQQIHDQLAHYHGLFDIYHPYEENNLYTVNELSGNAPVTVSPVILELLADCKDYYDLTGGRVNVAMGAVLQLWHEARTAGIQNPAQAKLPDADALSQAVQHTDMENLVLDMDAGTVFFRDPQMRLDVGAIAKGWAAQKVAQAAPAGMLISVGGNVCATGPKPGDTPWVIGIQNPEGGEYLHTVYVKTGAVVTSGDYQRTYWVGDQSYHHIIDPDTQMPARYWRSVTVVCEDSALADALSTALFLLPLQQGRVLVQAAGAQAYWLDTQGQEFTTPGFDAIIRT